MLGWRRGGIFETMHLAQGGLFSNGANQYIIEKKIDNHVTNIYILMIPNNSFGLIPPPFSFQSVANNFSDERMQNEYYLQKTYYMNMNMNIILDTLGPKYKYEYYS